MLHNLDNPSFEDAEEFYFALGQVLSAIFSRLGGTDKYRKEFNYLPNPYLPTNIRILSKRILQFLSKMNLRIETKNDSLLSMLHLLYSTEEYYLSGTISEKACQNAFYYGLHYDNMFDKLSP